ncbi:MAG: hypothetical protein DI539_04810 [Flavobacterium psychrophilum]|nr:MAG: hypothetical protein DI539_04810 [Flavobacterium psychrophilum]
MPLLNSQLLINRCPHCRVDSPNLRHASNIKTKAFDQSNPRSWYFYSCAKCGGVVTAAAVSDGYEILEIYPSELIVDDNIPEKAARYLDQAINSIHAPSGAVMLCASSVDAMLKEKGYKQGKLYNRIEEAVKAHLITKEMSKWAHEVRLDSNDERHADDEAEMPTPQDAKKAIDFTLALAEFLFVLPSRVERGLKEAKQEDENPV